jgi:hypothetical protein
MSKGILNSLKGRMVGLASDRSLVVPAGVRVGGCGKQIRLPGLDWEGEWYDFGGDVLPDQVNFIEGTGTNATFAVVAGRPSHADLVTGATAGTMAADGAILNTMLSYQADSGGLSFLTRLTLSALTTISIFAGFTDDKTTVEAPAHAASGTTFTTTATDAVGFLFDSTLTAAYWHQVGVKNNTDAANASLGVAPTAATYQWLQVDVDADGNATFFVNGLQVGPKLASAVTKTVALTPVIAVWPRTTSARTVSIDAFGAWQTRV